MKPTAALIAILLGSSPHGPAAADGSGPDPRALGAPCAGCHGTGGHGLGLVPDLAGKDPARFLEAMHGFQAGSRPATIMNRIAPAYSETDLAALAAYFREQ